jgi:DNA mismatch repair protein MLH1
LKAFEDLNSIVTYGFRGEALASISHIAHLTITTKTADSSCAWRAHYADGKLAPAKPGQSAEPKPTAGRGGTQITVEDLFYNIPQRRKAFKSNSEEYAKILDIVGKYAVHCDGVAFSCKKHGDSSMGIAISLNASTNDRVRQIHGSSIANELIKFETHDDRLGFKATGLASNANYHGRKTTILLFINHRSVESSAVKSAVQRTYSAFLPKGGHPFLYLSVNIDPQRVDVNVHPTKREVNFLNEDEIIDLICDGVRSKLSAVDTSRTFKTQTLLPSANAAMPPLIPSLNRSSSRHSTTPKPAENNLVRTDPALRKITSMLSAGHDSRASSLPDLVYKAAPKDHMQIRLTSINSLRTEVREAMHGSLTEVFATHTYVGLVDTARRLAAIQSGVKLFLVDYAMVCNEYFYQIGLTDFGNFGSMNFAEPLNIRALITAGVEIETQTRSSSLDLSKAPDLVTHQLIDRREMLLEYFNMDITEEGELRTLPLLVKGYMPSMAKLPTFLLRLGPCIDWLHEKACFQSFLTELASFYTPEQLPNRPVEETKDQMDHDLAKDKEGKEDAELDERRRQLSYMLEHTLFPAFRSRLVGTKGMLKGVVEVADLKGLYRVFERC